MSELLRISSTRRFLLFILMFLTFMDLAIFLNIPILRPVLGFTFLTVIPGLLILYSLKLNKLGFTERIVLSVGLSISFLMFFGLFINWVYPLFGYNTPLSTIPLILSLSVVILILAIIASVIKPSASFANLFNLKFNTREKAFLLVPALFPLLGILGMYLMNTTDNNIMLMAVIFLIPAYAIFIAVKHEQVPEKIYPPMIFLTSICLVLLLGLRSNHLIGVDIHSEYYFFQQTFHNGQWQILGNTVFDSCLSISILPTIYQSFLNINSEYLFKILYPVLFSISPLVVYVLSKKYIGSRYAFWASLFFMSQFGFLSAASNPRTVVAILFFGLSVMILFHSRLGDLSKISLFIIFAVSCIVSHYSTSFIFLFFLLFTWIGMQIFSRIIFPRGKPSLSRNPTTANNPHNSESRANTFEKPQPWPRTYMTSGIIALFFVFLFLWYSQVTGQTFVSGVKFLSSTLRMLPEFFIMEARGTEVAALFGSELEFKGIPHNIEFVATWFTIIFIIIGILTTLARYRRMVAFPSGENETPLFLDQKLGAEFFVCSLACSALLAATVALPYVLIGYSMPRTYLQMMTVLSPFFIIGGIVVAELLHIKRVYLIVLVALIPYFMCSTGAMYEMFDVPRGVTLTSEGRSYETLFIHDQETFCVRWLNDHAQENAIIYADPNGIMRLITQGGTRLAVYAGALIEDNQTIDGYVFLRYHNVVERKLVDRQNRQHDIADYQDELMGKAKIYTNGGSEVYR